jgi:hypothetical protein
MAPRERHGDECRARPQRRPHFGLRLVLRIGGPTSEAVTDEGQRRALHGFGDDGLPIAAW